MSSTLLTTPAAHYQRTRPETGQSRGVLLDFVLLLAMLMNLAWSLRSAEWTPGLDRLLPVAFMATVASALVALGGFGRVFSTLYSLVVGAAVLLNSVAVLAPEVILESRAMGGAGVNAAGDLSPSPLYEMQARAYYLVERTFTWIVNAVSGRPVADNLVFVLLLALVVWLLCSSAVWTYFRERRKWQAVLPVGLAMLINLYYAPPQLNIYFLFYVLLAILLLVRATLGERTQQWYEERIYYPFDIAFDFTRDALFFALFVILVAWILPTATSGGKLAALLEPFEAPWQQAQEEWNRLFSTLNYGRATGATPAFGTSMGLGGPREVTDTLVMDVKTPINRYYRGSVVDTYLAGGWTLAPTTAVHLDEVAVTAPAWIERREITQTMILYQPASVLVAAPQPVAVSIPVDTRLIRAADASAPLPAERNAPEEVEFAMLVARRVLSPAETYDVVSAITNATAPEMRNAGTEYPTHIRERYLQLPNTIPPRVFTLAEEIKGAHENAFDIARAVETYLRGIPYNDQIPGPRPGEDGVDYFLFEEKQGYCNYYASAMVVMLRHLGIPARIAIGYATGEYQTQTGFYRIRNLDLHAWVEVYFPDIGWVEFEPTASEPQLTRSEATVAIDDEEEGERIGDRENAGANENTPAPAEDAAPQTPSTPAERLLAWVQANPGWAGLLTIAGIALTVLASVRRMNRSARGGAQTRRSFLRVVPVGFAAKLWEKLMIWARRLGLSQHPSLTPLEQAAALTQRVPPAGEGIQMIADLYTRDLYSPHAITLDDANNAQMAWFEVRPRLQRQWFDQHLRLPAGLKRAIFRDE